MKTAKKERPAGMSNLLAGLMRGMDGNAVRNGNYYRGMTLTSKPYMHAIANLPMMAQGVCVFPVYPEDVNHHDANNAIGTGVREFINHGTFIETFEVLRDGSTMRGEVKPENTEAKMRWAASNPGKSVPMDIAEHLFPIQTEVMRNIKCVAVPGRMMLESRLGFAPFILIGTRKPENFETKWFRVSLQDNRPIGLNWLRQVFDAMKEYIY